MSIKNVYYKKDIFNYMTLQIKCFTELIVILSLSKYYIGFGNIVII